MIGVFAYQGELAAINDWSPLLEYLNTAIPEHRFYIVNRDLEGLREALKANELDLVITNPGYYIEMESEFGISRIATLVSPEAETPARALGAVVFTRASNTQLRDLSDLSGKTVAAVAPHGFAGYLIAARELAQHQVDPETDIKEMRFVGLPMGGIIGMVQRGEVDAGIVRTCLLETAAKEGLLRMEDFRVLSPRKFEGFACVSSTPLYPDWPIAVTRRTDATLAKAVARALLAMPPIRDGVSWTVPADYQPVHELYRELRTGPYTYLRDITPEALARRFWPWLLGIVIVLTGWVIHTIRVEYQVMRRTAELQDSLNARKAAENRMRAHQEQMEHLSRLSILGELSGNLAHEINQPLTTIGTYARTVLRRQASGILTPDAIAEACAEIASEADRAGGIVQRIRHFARKRVATREPVVLRAIAQEAVRLIVGMLAHTPDIIIEDRTEGKGVVLADGPQIQQVLLNLIKNAIDAARDLPPDRQTVRLTIEASDEHVQVHLDDHGAGLAPDQRAHLFEPFFTTKPDGLGLGLPICKTIIEAHGGRLWAEDNPDGQGMRFSFSLPGAWHEHAT